MKKFKSLPMGFVYLKLNLNFLELFKKDDIENGKKFFKGDKATIQHDGKDYDIWVDENIKYHL